ncbi:MAG TPA: SDR family oxidoreductase [Acidobacteriaceae bacterium]|nr:SDR family oxidoreductase [Acidobacteriaceae bacterium]
MRIFMTGATGFIGTATIPELLAAGHTVAGLARSDEGAAKLEKAGVEVVRGTLEDLAVIRKAAEKADGVIHLGFNHDFSKFAENCAVDRGVIGAVGEVLAGSDRRLIMTSGTGIVRKAEGEPVTENDVNVGAEAMPRALSETLAEEIAGKGVRVGIMRLPQVHDTRKQGLVSYAIVAAKRNGFVTYVGDGSNRWPAAHISDVAKLYTLAIEKGEPFARYHAVDEEGVSAKAIFDVVGKGLGLPVRSLSLEEAVTHMGFLGHFVGADLPASSAITRAKLGWKPTGPGLIADLEGMDYLEGLGARG